MVTSRGFFWGYLPLFVCFLSAPALAIPGRAPTRIQEGECDPGLSLPSQITSRTINGFSVRVDLGTGAFQVTPPGGTTPVMSGPGTCVASDTGNAPAIRVATGEPFALGGFGAFIIQLDGGRSDLSWAPPVGYPPTVSTGTGKVAMTWDMATPTPSQVSLRFEAYGTRDLRVYMTSSSTFDAAELNLTCGAEESFFGLGSQVAAMDLRGRTYPLWTQEGGIGKVEHPLLWPLMSTIESAYAPMGVLHSSAGWSAVLTGDEYAEMDLCDEDSGRLKYRAYGYPDMVLVGGASPKDRMTSLTDYVGRLTEPAPWLFAPWNDAVGGEDRLYEVSAKLRDNDIPSSVIWSEDWIGEAKTPFGFGLSYAWEWDPEAYPNLPQNIEDLHTSGFAFMAYFNPFVPKPTRMWEEGQAGDYLIHNEDGDTYVFADPFFRVTSLVDLTNPEALEWLKEYQVTAAADLGIDGWMTDFAEWLPVDAVMSNGEIGWEAHNRYPLMWQQASRDALEDAHASGLETPENWAFFARSGWASVESGGSAGTSLSMWGGDQNTNWRYGDGFPSVVPIATHLGLSGVAVFGSDIGGYTNLMSPPTTKELYLRWSALGAFHPLMRTHHGLTECENWSFDRDDDTLQHHRRYAQIHTLLFPYLWAAAEDAMELGWPLSRHPWLEEPNRPGLWEGDHYGFFLGNNLWIQPVLREGATRWEIKLPDEGWWPLFGENWQAGSLPGEGNIREVTLDVPATELPVFVRPGTVLVLLPRVVDSFYGVSAPGMTDLSDVVDQYAIGLYPDKAGSLATTPVGEASVGGGGFTAVQVDWSKSKVGGVAVASCTSTGGAAPCYNGAGETLTVAGTNLDITVGGASVAIRSIHSQRYTLGVGRHIWGTLANATPLGDLSPDIPPPCGG